MNLKNKYEEIKQDYIKSFEEKHGIRFIKWINEDHLSEFKDSIICLSYENIRFDIDNNIDKTFAIEYCEYMDKPIMGYTTYKQYIEKHKDYKELINES